jgi:hypothetical protein
MIINNNNSVQKAALLELKFARGIESYAIYTICDDTY